MYLGRTTLSKFLIEQLHEIDDGGQLAGLLVDVAAAMKSIAAATAKGVLGGFPDASEDASAPAAMKKKLDALSNDALIGACEWGGMLAGMLSEQLEEPYAIPPAFKRGRYLLCFDPLDGASNIDVNVSVGTIFSVLVHDRAEVPAPEDYLQHGRRQVAAGYAIYGPATMLVITVGRGTHGFTLDREIGNFILTHENLRIPEDTSEFAINTSNERFWEPPVMRYVAECKAGKTGVRERDFNMRWIASMVAEVHRILMRGGVFMYPRDTKNPYRTGRLRLLYEANPIGFVVEQAGGASSYGRGATLDHPVTQIHERVPVILGSKNEVERIERYHAEYDAGVDKPYASPLFRDRSMFTAER